MGFISGRRKATEVAQAWVYAILASISFLLRLLISSVEKSFAIQCVEKCSS